MIEWLMFYKLLEIPGSIANPTYYHILGVDPRQCTPSIIKNALEKQKKTIRQNIPSPQFIPLVARFEIEVLEVAAKTLSTNSARSKYNKFLKKETIKEKSIENINTEKSRSDLLKEGRALILGTVDQDGALSEFGRETVSQGLIKIGYSNKDIEHIFNRFPFPRKMVSSQNSEASINYFDDAILISIRYAKSSAFCLTTNHTTLADGTELIPVFTSHDEKKLLRLATHIGLSQTQAINQINALLHSENIMRGNRDPDILKQQYVKWVEAMIPDGLLDDEDYTKLINFAKNEGLSEQEATTVIREYVAEKKNTSISRLKFLYAEPDDDPILHITDILDEILYADNQAPLDKRSYIFKKWVLVLIIILALISVLITISNNGNTVKRGHNINDTPQNRSVQPNSNVHSDKSTEIKNDNKPNKQRSLAPNERTYTQDLNLLKSGFTKTNWPEEILADVCINELLSIRNVAYITNTTNHNELNLSRLLLSKQRQVDLLKDAKRQQPKLSPLSNDINYDKKSLAGILENLYSRQLGKRLNAIKKLSKQIKYHKYLQDFVNGNHPNGYKHPPSSQATKNRIFLEIKYAATNFTPPIETKIDDSQYISQTFADNSKKLGELLSHLKWKNNKLVRGETINAVGKQAHQVILAPNIVNRQLQRLIMSHPLFKNHKMLNHIETTTVQAMALSHTDLQQLMVNYSAQTMYLKHLLSLIPITKSALDQIIAQETITEKALEKSTNVLKSIRTITFENTTLYDKLSIYMRGNK